MKPRGIFCLLAAALNFSTGTHAQQWDWVRRFSGESISTAIGLDTNQNVYVAGTFSGTVFMGTNRFVSAGGNDVFLLKMSPEGEINWALGTGGFTNDSIQRLVVANDGALFVVGNFTIPASLLNDSAHSGDVSNVFVARVDDGRFTWFKTLPGNGAGHGGGVAFAPDGAVWVVAATNQEFLTKVFLTKYDPAGRELNSFVFSNYFQPTGLAVNQHEQLFVSSWTFLGRVDHTGELRWMWSPGDGYFKKNILNQIVCTPEGDLLSVGTSNSGFRDGSSLVKHSPDGITIAQSARWGWSHKSLFHGNGVATDGRGNVHVIGLQVGHYLGPHPSDGLWLATYSNGTLIVESTIPNRTYSSPWNDGRAIVATPDGAIYIAGRLTGSAFFGTNEVEGAVGAFVARRSTLAPELNSERVGTNVVLSWPKAAFPFALQQSDETGTNWKFVGQPPERVGLRWQIRLPAEQTIGTFRLFRTNEAPIRHVPVLYGAWGSGAAFLNRRNAVIAGAPLYFWAGFKELDNEPLSVWWSDAATGLPLDGETNIEHYAATVLNHTIYSSGALTSYRPAPDAFREGTHTIQVIASDGIFSATNSWTFEVINTETALQEFWTALEVLRGDRLGRQALAFLEAFRRADAKGHDKLAEKRWTRFQRQLARVKDLDADQRAKLSSASELLKPFLAPQ